jgi:hypothetical protein
MKTALKRALLRAATATAIACTAAIVFLPAVASAAPGEATGSVNVRGGPGTSYPIVDRLSPGEDVDVLGCRLGWCYIQHPGPDGYVSSSYIRRSGGGASFGSSFNLSFNFPNGSFSIGTGGGSIVIGPEDPPAPGGGSLPADVCFYSGSGYSGSRFCMDEGDLTPYVGAEWNNRISSIRNPDGLSVLVCDDAGYDDCRTYRTSARSLGSFNNVISSIRIR